MKSIAIVISVFFTSVSFGGDIGGGGWSKIAGSLQFQVAEDDYRRPNLRLSFDSEARIPNTEVLAAKVDDKIVTVIESVPVVPVQTEKN